MPPLGSHVAPPLPEKLGHVGLLDPLPKIYYTFFLPLHLTCLIEESGNTMRSDKVKKGAARAPHRCLLRGAGVGEGNWDKPFIAVCNSYTNVIAGHTHLNKVGEFVKQCVIEAGGVPFEFNTIGICDGVAMGHPGMKYSLPSRELIADCVESMMNAHCFDGMICIPNCDKIVPGMLMGSLRVNVPTIFVSGGPMEAGRTPDGKAADLISVFSAAAAQQQGKISEAELTELEQIGCPTCGSCSGMFTANSMNCLCEAVGIAPPMNGTLIATSTERKKLYQWAAKRIMEMVKQYDAKGEGQGLLPREIITQASLDNSMVLDMAMGGSTNTVLHILCPSPTRRAPTTTSSGSTASAARRPTSARSPPVRTTTWKTSITPAAFTAFSAA